VTVLARASLADLPRIAPQSREEWRGWLEANHASSGSVWLVLPKKGSGLSGPALSDAVDEAICFGWIDSLPRKLDDRRSLLLMSPRKPGSNWSAVNKAKVERLILQGRMHPAGMIRIEAARADGSWNALDEVETLSVPEDLAAALGNHPGARMNWDAFPPSARRGILEWIGNARTGETRARRVAETASLAARNIRANQWPRR
jgi:uncharacterized protein YdeI (YjbR/CyaY-like superfamily)